MQKMFYKTIFYIRVFGATAQLFLKCLKLNTIHIKNREGKKKTKRKKFPTLSNLKNKKIGKK